MSPSPLPDDGVHDDGVDAATRLRLRSRLDDIAAATEVDPGAWESFEARLAAQGGNRRHPPRALLAAAAALVVLGVAMVLLRDGDGGGRVDIAHDSTTTTRETRRPDRTTSTTAPGTTSTTTTTAGVAPEAHGSDPGDGSPSGGTRPRDVAPSTTTTSPPPTSQRATPALTLPASGGAYTVELIWDGGTMYFRRSDDVGTAVPGPPDGHGHVESAGWGSVGAAGCLASSGQEYGFPDAARRAFTWGVMGADIARVEVVMADGTRRTARSGGGLGGGVRPWIVERPLGSVQRIEGRNASGDVVASITEMTGDWGSSGC